MPEEDNQLAELERLEEKDYYAVLNVSQDASSEEIKAAYRRWCLLFHPDKQTDQETKKIAEKQFIAIQKAYDVLTDERKRYIYDRYGKVAVDQCWDLVQRSSQSSSRFTADEIVKEWERRKREQEIKKGDEGWTSEGHVSVTVNAVPMWDIQDKLQYGPVSWSDRVPEISAIAITQKFNKVLVNGWTGIAQCGLQTSNGMGAGTFLFGLHKHITTATSLFMSISVGNEVSSLLMIQRRLSEAMSLDVKLKTAFESGFIRPGVGLSINRVIFSGVTAKFGVDLGLKHSVSFGLVSKNEKTAVGTNVIFSDRAIGFNAKYTHRIDDETKIKFRLSTGSLAAGTTHRISNNSQFSNLLEVNAQSGVILYCNWKRMGSSFEVPIILHLQPHLLTSLIGSIIPTVLAFAVRNFIIEPRRRQRKKERLEKFMSEKMELLEKLKSEALDAQRLLRESAQKKCDDEKAKDGLVIIKALYGRLESMDDVSDNINDQTSDPDFLGYDVREPSESSCIIDVTIPLQNLVSDSQLKLPVQPKNHFIGFYDPFLGEKKHLRIVYRYGPQRALHQVTLEDSDAVRIPLRSHIIV